MIDNRSRCTEDHPLPCCRRDEVRTIRRRHDHYFPDGPARCGADDPCVRPDPRARPRWRDPRREMRSCAEASRGSRSHTRLPTSPGCSARSPSATATPSSSAPGRCASRPTSARPWTPARSFSSAAARRRSRPGKHGARAFRSVALGAFCRTIDRSQGETRRGQARDDAGRFVNKRDHLRGGLSASVARPTQVGDRDARQRPLEGRARVASNMSASHGRGPRRGPLSTTNPRIACAGAGTLTSRGRLHR
jgi:hypothetical protein